MQIYNPNFLKIKLKNYKDTNETNISIDKP